MWCFHVALFCCRHLLTGACVHVYLPLCCGETAPRGHWRLPSVWAGQPCFLRVEQSGTITASSWSDGGQRRAVFQLLVGKACRGFRFSHTLLLTKYLIFPQAGNNPGTRQWKVESGWNVLFKVWSVLLWQRRITVQQVRGKKKNCCYLKLTQLLLSNSI